MKKTCLLGLLVLISATGVSAHKDKDKDDTDKTAAADQKEKPKDKMICRTENATGSLTNVKRTCMTASQWNALAQQTRKDINDTINRQTGPWGQTQQNPGPGGPGT